MAAVLPINSSVLFLFSIGKVIPRFFTRSLIILTHCFQTTAPHFLKGYLVEISPLAHGSNTSPPCYRWIVSNMKSFKYLNNFKLFFIYHATLTFDWINSLNFGKVMNKKWFYVAPWPSLEGGWVQYMLGLSPKEW